MKKTILLSISTACFMLAAQPVDTNSSEYAAVAATMKKELGGQLKSKVEKEGIEAAFSFCSASAMQLTKKIANEQNVSIKRVTTKPRNPLNTPDEPDMQAVKTYEKYKTEAQAPKNLTLSDGKTTRFYEPMYVTVFCLPCHGKPDVRPEQIKKLSSKLYPNDKATDYEVGDFRGLIVVEKK